MCGFVRNLEVCREPFSKGAGPSLPAVSVSSCCPTASPAFGGVGILNFAHFITCVTAVSLF